LVNDDVEMLGVPDALDEVVEDDDALVLELELALALGLELEDELPHPAATTTTPRLSAHSRNRLKLITARSSHRRATSTLVNSYSPVVHPGREIHWQTAKPPSTAINRP
jgi:hypothetical protein